MAVGFLQQYVDSALDQAGGGDPYDEPNPGLGRAISLSSGAHGGLAVEGVEAAADRFAAADASVSEGD